jgi:hypothetical protein
MRFILLAAALAAAVPSVAKSDELTDLKAQLQAVQKRLQALEAEKAKSNAGQPALTARASAALPAKATPVSPISLDPPVVAPNEKPEIKVAGPERPRVELYGAAQVDAIYDTKKMDPVWGAAFRPSKIAVNCPPVGVDPGCGTNGLTTFSARQSKFGVKSSSGNPGRRGQDPVRVRPVRAGRQRRPDHVPSAAGLGFVGSVPGRPYRQPVHGRRCIPQHHRLLGPQRHDLHPRSAIAMDAL